MIVLLAALLAISSALSSYSTPPPNWRVQQKQCAEPGSPTMTCRGKIEPVNCRCSTQLKSISCDNWHGCTFDCGPNNDQCTYDAGEFKCKDHSCCVYDPRCHNLTLKPLRVPTLNPTPKPTMSPTIICHVPAGGCETLNEAACGIYNGCAWNFQNNICQAGGCSGTFSPTVSPTPCTDQPLHGCLSIHSARGCQQFNCCQWHGTSFRKGGRCNPASSGSAPPPVLTPGSAPSAPQSSSCNFRKRKACNRHHICHWAHGSCAPKSG